MVVFSPVKKIAPPRGSLFSFAVPNTVLNVKLESEMVTLLPVRQMVPPFDVDTPVTES